MVSDSLKHEEMNFQVERYFESDDLLDHARCNGREVLIYRSNKQVLFVFQLFMNCKT